MLSLIFSQKPNILYVQISLYKLFNSKTDVSIVATNIIRQLYNLMVVYVITWQLKFIPSTIKLHTTYLTNSCFLLTCKLKGKRQFIH